MKAAIGLRVVRGPHWELSDQRGDGGEGFVGTLVEVGGTEGSKLLENKVWVQWDSGMRRVCVCVCVCVCVFFLFFFCFFN